MKPSETPPSPENLKPKRTYRKKTSQAEAAALSPEDKPLSLIEAFKAISLVGGILVMVLTIIASLSFSALLAGVLKGEDITLDNTGLELIFSYARVTAPLTVGLIIIILTFYEGWIKNIILCVLFASIVLIGTTLIFNQDSHGHILKAWHGTSKWYDFPLKMISGYAEFYGWQKFLASVIISFFTVWLMKTLVKIRSVKD